MLQEIHHIRQNNKIRNKRIYATIFLYPHPFLLEPFFSSTEILLQEIKFQDVIFHYECTEPQ